MTRQAVVWVRQGTTRWGDGWVAQHGRSKSHEAGMMEHVSFANYDLQQNGLPTIGVSSQGLFVEIDGDHREAMAILRVISYHGFEFLD